MTSSFSFKSKPVTPSQRRKPSSSSLVVCLASIIMSMVVVSQSVVVVEAFVGQPSSFRPLTLQKQQQQQQHYSLLSSPTRTTATTKKTTLSTPISKTSSLSSSTALPISLQMVWPSRDPKGMAQDFPDTKSRVVAGILATLFTWHGIVMNKMNPVLASSATTLAISLWSPGLGQAAFAGSFAGMNAHPSLAMILATGTITAGLFEILVHRKNKWLGLGGKLSFQAFMATNLTAFLFRRGSPITFSKSLFTLQGWAQVFRDSPCFYGIFCGAVGSILTIFLREIAEFNPNRDNDLQDPVRSSAVIGILSAMLMGIGEFIDYNGAMMMFGGAFTGMSYPSRLLKGIIPGRTVNRKYPDAINTIIWFGAAGAIGGLIHALTLTLGWYTGGWGGKAGTCAFAGVLIFRLLEKIVYSIRERFHWTTPIESTSTTSPVNGEEMQDDTSNGIAEGTPTLSTEASSA